MLTRRRLHQTWCASLHPHTGTQYLCSAPDFACGTLQEILEALTIFEESIRQSERVNGSQHHD